MSKDIAALYAQGLSCRDIAELLGICDETVRKHLMRQGIERRPKSHKKPKPIPTWEGYFKSRVEPSGECLLWTGFRDETGYGRCQAAFAPQIFFAHRLSWFLRHGSLDLSLRVLHTCDTPPCVNPDHLWLGTQTDNIADMVSKGRQRRGPNVWGEDHPHAKLSEQDVIRMRKLRDSTGLAFNKIAKKFGVTTMTAWRACNGQCWGHIEETAT